MTDSVHLQQSPDLDVLKAMGIRLGPRRTWIVEGDYMISPHLREAIKIDDWEYVAVPENWIFI